VIRVGRAQLESLVVPRDRRSEQVGGEGVTAAVQAAGERGSVSDNPNTIKGTGQIDLSAGGPCSQDFNAAYLGIVLDRGELNRDLAAAVCVRGELFDHGNILAACGGEDVEVAQHLRAIDRDIEESCPRTVPVDLGKVQSRGIRSSRREVGNGVGEVAI